MNKPIALDSHEFQGCDNMFGIEEAPAPTHGGHRRYQFFSDNMFGIEEAPAPTHGGHRRYQSFSDNMVGIEEAPAPTHGGHRRYQSFSDNMFGIEEAPAPTHGGHRRNQSFSYAMERPRKEASVEDCRASCGLKGIWPFLKEKMSWRIVKRLQRHFTNKFLQNGGNKVDHLTDDSVILDFSPNHPDNGYSNKVEKENDGPKALSKPRAFFRNLAALARTAKSSLRLVPFKSPPL